MILYARQMPPKPDRNGARASRHGVARVISKLGMASRSLAAKWVHEGRVRVNGRSVRDPDFPVSQGQDRISVDERDIAAAARVVLMLNKPRGLVTTCEDEQGRATVYQCLANAPLPWLAAVGRLDKASEGLLLFTNDSTWAARITNPATGPDKTYHVQIDRVPGWKSYSMRDATGRYAASSKLMTFPSCVWCEWRSAASPSANCKRGIGAC